MRWLLSTVPTAMIFDDHDVIDDWNTSRDWVAAMRAQGWWDERIVGAFMSYWCYQHLGNLSPEDRDEDACYRAVRAAEGDAGAIVRDFAFRADREVAGARWSYKRDIGRTRIVVDGLARRPRARARARARWSTPRSGSASRSGRAATSTTCCWAPRCRSSSGRGMHYLEAWNEAVGDGAWGGLASRAAERLRQGLDLEHWAAFGDSLRALERLLDAIASGRHGSAPGTVVLLSGDVHHAYLADARPADGRSDAWQSPRLPGGVLAAAQPAGRARAPRDQAGDVARRRARRADPGPRGRRGGRAADAGRSPTVRGSTTRWPPWTSTERRCRFRLESAAGAGDEPPRLEQLATRRLA